MPELPEVETIVRALRQGGRGAEGILTRQIEETQLLWERTLATPASLEFHQRVIGQRVLSVGRRGKFLLIQLSSDYLLIHLRMSGDLRVEPSLSPQAEPVALQPHDRLVLNFTDNTRLVFNDARKFGRAWLVTNPEQVVGGLGPEPFDPTFTAYRFYQRLQLHARQIKPLLLDQSFLAGLGNIYTDEALYIAGIHPLRPASSLTPEHAGILWTAIRTVLNEGIRRNGASFDWVYRGGDFQNNFQVYQQTGKPCQVCGTIIVKTTVGQRGTHYCPTCQPIFEGVKIDNLL
jgi:formamidopyrimidine-DNA glycosylase